MAKTPYELRHELLMMAQGILTENLMNERIRLENDWNVERERASIRMSNGELHITVPPYPVIPMISPEEIIKLASRLNEFVSDNGEKTNV